MSEERLKQAIRLRLLALVLALALTWYVTNPAPAPVRWVKRDEETPDEERRVTNSPAGAGYRIELTGTDAMMPTVSSSASAPEADIEDLEWPEVIGVG
jgi:hypothetical protein